MSTIPGNPFRCPKGHGQLLPYSAMTVTAWCDECKSTQLLAQRLPSEIIRTPEDSAQTCRLIGARIAQLAKTFEEVRRGLQPTVEPDPKTEAEKLIVQRLRTGGFPEKHIATLPKMDCEGQTAVRDVMDALRGHDSRTVILWGDYGTGKTQTATAWAMQRAGVKAHTRYISAPDLTRALRDNFETKIPEAMVLARFIEAPGLVIDEIQAALDENPARSSWARTHVQNIVDKRYSSTKPLKTVLICNADSLEALTAKLGAHILSRVQEAGAVLRVSRRNYRALAAASRRAA